MRAGILEIQARQGDISDVDLKGRRRPATHHINRRNLRPALTPKLPQQDPWGYGAY